MSKRRFTSFVDAWVEYADNKFAPKEFHLWSGLSLVSAALERKVWLPISHKKNLYPNLYVFLVSFPGVGKSSAIDHATDFLREHNQAVGDEGEIRIVPDQVTEAKLIELMSKQKSFQVSSDRVLKHSSAFYPVSEASNCLKEIKGAGDLVSTLTNFHDCPAAWNKGTKKDNIERLSNVYFSLLAGSTFDFLNKLITGEGLFGGFASRVIYVVHAGKVIRKVRFGEGDGSDEKLDVRNRLLADFREISNLHGSMKADPEFAKAYEAWYPTFEEYRQSHKSGKLQALLARKPSNVLKVAALLSASESNDLILKREHWDRALGLVSDLEKFMPSMLREANSGNRTADHLIQAILGIFDRSESNSVIATSIRSALTLRGFDPRKVDATLTSLASSGVIRVDKTEIGHRLTLLVDPDNYL